MKVPDETLEYYAERYIEENQLDRTGLTFIQYLYTMVKLDEFVVRRMETDEY